MFRFGRALARHKIGVITVIAFAVVLWSYGGNRDRPAHYNPWAKTSSAQDSGQSWGGRIAGVASSAVGIVTGQDGINPAEVGQETAGRFDAANEALATANRK